MYPFYLALLGWLLTLINVFIFIRRLRSANKKFDLYLVIVSVLNFIYGFFLLTLSGSLQKKAIEITTQFNVQQLNLSGKVLILSSILICAFVAMWAIFRISAKKNHTQ